MLSFYYLARSVQIFGRRAQTGVSSRTERTGLDFARESESFTTCLHRVPARWMDQPSAARRY